MERPDWADGLEAKGALQTSECTHTTWKLELLMVPGCQGEHAVEHLHFITSSSLFTECSQWYHSDG